MAEKLRIALVGATGLVGLTALKVLDEQQLPPFELFPFASEQRAGSEVTCNGKSWTVQAVPHTPPEVDYALFTAPGNLARNLVPDWLKAGIRIIDNASVFRMAYGVPLIVPEVNAFRIQDANGLIANPNCSTIQLAVALAPLHRKWGLRRVSVATYQAVAGAGRDAVEDWKAEVEGKSPVHGKFPAHIHANVLPQIGEMDENGYNVEEVKLSQEMTKILELTNVPIAATCVRVPVEIGHAEAVEVQLADAPAIEDVLGTLERGSGIILHRKNESFPMPIDIAGQDPVHVGRVRRHPMLDDTYLLWVVADNLRKGAATNAVQILQRWITQTI